MTHPLRRRQILGLFGLTGTMTGCQLLGLGGATSSSPSSSGGATTDHLRRMVREAMEPKAAKLEDQLRRAVRLAAGIEATNTTAPEAHPVGAMIDKYLRNGGKLKVEPMLDTSSLRLEDDSSKLRMGSMSFGEERSFDESFNLLEDAADILRLEALRSHLDVLLTMVSWRRDGVASLGDDEAEAFREALAVARKVDTLSALALTGLALIQSQVAGQAKAKDVDRFFGDTAKVFPVSGTATLEEVRALYDGLAVSVRALVEELVRVATDRIPSPHKERISKGLSDMFAPAVALAEEAEQQAQEPPRSSGPDVGEALFAYGSALFPGIGVAIKGYEAIGALFDGKPAKAIELAATMIPGGETALTVVKQSASVLGVKLPLGL
ncbi:MAG: hypothetical protein KC731_23505 [Myxococcales bacterium]|nr:hypothetical protein [Myxococcales bacterium]